MISWTGLVLVVLLLGGGVVYLLMGGELRLGGVDVARKLRELTQIGVHGGMSGMFEGFNQMIGGAR